MANYTSAHTGAEIDAAVEKANASILADGDGFTAKSGNNAFKLGGREVNDGVPYFRSEKTNGFTALDIIPNGTGGVSTTGKAWIHVLNNDLGEAASDAWEGLLLAMTSDKAQIGADHGSSGTLRNLHVGGSTIIFQDRAQSPTAQYAAFDANGFKVGPTSTPYAWYTSTAMRLAQSCVIRWTGTDSATATGDAGLARSEAKVVQVTNGNQNVGGALEFIEMTAPSGKFNCARIYAEDDGSGKTRLMVQFASGAPVQLAIQP